VGTPGRVLDMIKRKVLRLDSIRVAVLDEADRMLDIDFMTMSRRF
jgi:ATP-dependent RNA helicase DeaD